MKTIIFFNNKGGVGKTTLAYHFAWMLADKGKKCLAVDLDPQMNLTSMFLTDEQLEEIMTPDSDRETILKGYQLLDNGEGDIQDVPLLEINKNIHLIAGDLELSLFEDKLSYNWTQCLAKDAYAFKIVGSFYRIIQASAAKINADYTIVDVGPNFGAINRVTLISGDYLIIPMAADLFSLQGLKNIGSRIKTWKSDWDKRKHEAPTHLKISLPQASMNVLGYVIMQQGIKENRPVKSYLRWANKIPKVYQEYIMNTLLGIEQSVESDPNCLAMLKHYHSLVPMAMETKKPIFYLKPADGAIGAHFGAVQMAYRDFELLVEKVESRIESIEG